MDLNSPVIIYNSLIDDMKNGNDASWPRSRAPRQRCRRMQKDRPSTLKTYNLPLASQSTTAPLYLILPSFLNRILFINPLSMVQLGQCCRYTRWVATAASPRSLPNIYTFFDFRLMERRRRVYGIIICKIPELILALIIKNR